MSLIDSVKKNEGYRPRVYQCTEGYDTIGYGFAIKDLHLEEDICDMILERKLADLKLIVNQKIPFIGDLPEAVQDVLYEMYYQMGNSLWNFKKTIQFLRLGNFEAASSEMLDSRWSRQTPNRSKRLSDIVKYAK